jgi:hypothetical protein
MPSAQKKRVTIRDELIVQELLSAFQACREEILERSRSQGGLIRLAVTAIGALGALTFSQYGDKILLLLIPVIVIPLGLLWLDHASNIFLMGNFIRDRIVPLLRASTNFPRFPDYEKIAGAHVKRRMVIIQVFGLPIALIFVVPSIVSLILALDAETKDWVFWMLYYLDIILVLIFSIGWFPFLIKPRP